MNKIIQYILNLFRKEKRNIGLVESPVDWRDYLYEIIFKKDNPTPEEYEIPYILPINNQGNSPQCVGESCRVIKVEKERREGNNVDFDPLWIYNKAKEIDGIPKVNGTYFRIGLKVLKNTGAKALNESDYNKYRISAYTKVNPNFDDIKRAIYENGVVLAGFHLSNAGWSKANIRKPYANETIFGHAVPCVGFTKDKIKFQNSWGDNWGDKGYGYFDKDNLPFECWTVLSDLPNNFKELMNVGEKPQYNFIYDLWEGQTAQQVKVLQDCLKWEGCMNKDVDSTGYFGKITKEAVMVFQSRYGISPVRGFVGPKTQKQLNLIFN